MTDILLSVFPSDCQASPCFMCKRMHTEANQIEPISGTIISLFARCDRHSPRFFLETCEHYTTEQDEEEQ